MPLYFLKSSFSWAIIFPYLCKYSPWQTQRQNQNFLSLNQRMKSHHQQNILFLWYRLPKFDLNPCQKKVLSLMRKRITWLKKAFKSNSVIVSGAAFWEKGCNLYHVREHLGKYNNLPTVALLLLREPFNGGLLSSSDAFYTISFVLTFPKWQPFLLQPPLSCVQTVKKITPFYNGD